MSIEAAHNIKKFTPPCAVPDLRDLRERMLLAARGYVARHALVPPLSMEDLDSHAKALLGAEAFPAHSQKFLMVLLGNEVWRDTVAGIPYERRILLLPQCLRSSAECPAEMDEFGLLCQECGRCPIGELQSLAENLGYVVLVAEGTTVVIKLLQRGQVDAVIGVSCLASLEKSFPHTAAHAIPGIAVPLFMDGCKDTKVDVSWVREAILGATDDGWRAQLDPDALRGEVRTWFEQDAARARLGFGATETERIALEWLVKAGKRWRPFLVACVYQALTDPAAPIPEAVRNLALAVECFHKASLVHDDIEDGDALRYDEATLHETHGIPVALNIGDLLLGGGYELIAHCGAAPARTARISAVAAEAHRKLCLGQGEEMTCLAEDAPPPVDRVLDIFRLKTAPAFDVALQFGALAAGCGDDVCRTLHAFSDALGVAYQIKDDLDDIKEDAPPGTATPMLLSALAQELPAGRGRDAAAAEKAALLFEHYKHEAIRALTPLRHAELKTLLRRLVTKILGGV